MEDDWPERKYWGKYPGFVRDNLDPENRGRIRLFCPNVMGPADNTSNWLGWAEPCFPWMGGLTSGEFGPPFTKKQQIDSFGKEYFGVWVEFQQGIPDFPIWSGMFVIAPLSDDERALTMGVDGDAGLVGGSIIGSTTSEDDALNPPKSEIGREVRLRAPRGSDIVIGSNNGGYIIIGPSGIHIVGTNITINGVNYLVSQTQLSK